MGHLLRNFVYFFYKSMIINNLNHSNSVTVVKTIFFIGLSYENNFEDFRKIHFFFINL